MGTAPVDLNTPANPFSTGAGGSVFELKVQSGLLTTLLVRGIVPCVEMGRVTEVHLQSGHKEFETDDALVFASDAGNKKRKILWSIKHDVKFIESNDVFREVIEDAWKDFSAPNRFNPELDSIVLATGPLTAAVYSHIRTLLEWARASIDSKDFASRVARKQYASEKMRAYLALINKFCDAVGGQKVDEERLWRFLRCLHLLTYDFDQQASQDEARFQTLLSLVAKPGTPYTGSTLWNAIFRLVADLNGRAGSFTYDCTTFSALRDACVPIASHIETGAVHRLLDHTKLLLRRIQTTLGPNIQLPRTDVVDKLTSAIIGGRFVLVTGAAGVGKSAATLPALDRCREGAPLFVFQATEFAYEHLDQALDNLRIHETLPQLSSLFALHPEKFLLIESVERLLEAQHREGFFMFLETVAADPSWRIVLTCRQHATQMVREAFLYPLNLDCVEVLVPLLSDEELDVVLNKVTSLSKVAMHPQTRRLLRNPWYLDKACGVDWSRETDAKPLDEARLRDTLWRQVVMRDSCRKDGMHLQREARFRSIAIRRARSLQAFVALERGEESVAQELIRDELLVEEPGTSKVAPAHDVLEDWALVRWIAETFSECGNDPKVFFQKLGAELPVRRSYRQWLQEVLGTDNLSEVRHFTERVLSDQSVEAYWRDETIVSILLSEEVSRFIRTHEAALLANGKRDLMLVIHLLRTACKKPNPNMPLDEVTLARMFGDIHLVPNGQGWAEVLRLIHRNVQQFALSDMPLVLGLLEDWKSGIHWTAPTPDGGREVGLIVLHFWRLAWAEEVWQEKVWERLATLILAAPQAIPDEFQALLDEISEKERRDARERRATQTSIGFP